MKPNMVGLAIHFIVFSGHLDAIQAKTLDGVYHQTPLFYYWKFPINVSWPQLQISGLHLEGWQIQDQQLECFAIAGVLLVIIVPRILRNIL